MADPWNRNNGRFDCPTSLTGQQLVDTAEREAALAQAARATKRKKGKAR
jgi:hypothetical protein